MVLHLSEVLEVPLRERNQLLTAAGFAPVYRETSLDDPQLQSAKRMVSLILQGHEPNPALAYDRHWMLVQANKALMLLLREVDRALLEPPVNLLRLALHPQGLAQKIVGFSEYRAYALKRLGRQIDRTGDPFLSELLRELRAYPSPPVSLSSTSGSTASYTGLVVKLRMEVDHRTLSFFSASTVLGTPVDVTLSELAIESFFPADKATAEALLQIAETEAAAGPCP